MKNTNRATKSTVSRTASAIRSDIASATRHWEEVLAGATIRASLSGERESAIARYNHEKRIAAAALIAIRAGKSPSLIMGEAAIELGISK